MSEPRTKNQEPRTSAKPTLFIAVAVLAMILLQVFASRIMPKHEPPGSARGDLVLVEYDLPSEISGWKRTRFTPAPPPEELPKGQYWWVHQWLYSNGANTAIVSLDQLGEDQWHELTKCYQSIGWTIQSRSVCKEAGDDDGTYVVVELRKDSDAAILVFSVYYEDGTWAAAPSVDLAYLNARPLRRSNWMKARDYLFPFVTFTEQPSGHTMEIGMQIGPTSGDKSARKSDPPYWTVESACLAGMFDVKDVDGGRLRPDTSGSSRWDEHS